MNVYQIYIENGCHTGFYIQRDTWGKTIFLVESIGGKTSGPLKGKAPYFDNPPVKGKYFDLNKQPKQDLFGKDLSCPGCCQWRQVS